MGLGPMFTTLGVGTTLTGATIANAVNGEQKLPSATTSVIAVSSATSTTVQMYDSFSPGIEEAEMRSQSIAASAYVEQLSDEELEELSIRVGILDSIEDDNVKTL